MIPSNNLTDTRPHSKSGLISFALGNVPMLVIALLSGIDRILEGNTSIKMSVNCTFYVFSLTHCAIASYVTHLIVIAPFV